MSRPLETLESSNNTEADGILAHTYKYVLVLVLESLSTYIEIQLYCIVAVSCKRTNSSHELKVCMPNEKSFIFGVHRYCHRINMIRMTIFGLRLEGRGRTEEQQMRE